MKKILVVLAVLSSALAASANLLTNGDFEQGETSWTISGNSGDEGWAAHQGTNGYACWGWLASPGSAYQEALVGGGGTYTFAVWVRRESEFQSTNTQLKLGWYNSVGGQLQTDTVYDFTALPADSQWHHIFVTGTCSSSELARVRVTMDMQWTAAGGSVIFDEADLYQGTYVKSNAFRNSSFEDTGSGQQRNSGWSCVPELGWETGGGFASDWWAPRSGTNAIAIYSWDDYKTNYSGAIIQNFNAVDTTGAYTFAIWIKREANVLASNAYLRIGWYDNTFTNMVQDGAITNLTLLNDGVWHEYYVVSMLTNLAFHEVRVQLDLNWSFNPAGDPRSMMIDDTRFMAGAYDGDSIESDWAYHAAKGYYAVAEQVPGGGNGAFLQANYVTGTNTFYALSKHPTVARFEGESGSVGLRTSWQRPNDGSWSNDIYNMTYIGTLELDSAAPFHSLPGAGTVTVDVWRTQAPQPKDLASQPFTTNTVPFYYAPYLQTTIGVQNAGIEYLLFNDGNLTNNLGQIVGPDYGSKDYLYWNRVPAPNASLTNGDFELQTGWIMAGRTGYEGWANHSGTSGVAFWSWEAGDSILYQDVETTGGVYCFASSFRVEQNCNPVDIRMRMEWHDTNGIVVQVNERDLTSHPRTSVWAKVDVVGQCFDPGLDFVRLSFSARYGNELASGTSSIMIDDAELVEVGSALQNVGFEDVLVGSGWFVEGTERQGWANRSGSYGAAFSSWNPGASTMFQHMTTTGGMYEFSLHMKIETNANPTMLEMSMQWYDLNGVMVQENTQDILAWGESKKSDMWSHYGVLGACLSNDLSHVRCLVRGTYDDSSDIGDNTSAIMIDDVSVTPVRTAIENASFEIGNGVDIREWYGVPQWLVEIHDWGWRTGTNGAAFHGWTPSPDTYDAVLFQPVAVPAGTYEFTVWIKREVNFLLSDAELRLEWYGADYPNKVQADTVKTISPPADGVWAEYSISGTCADPDVCFAVPVVYAEWTGNDPGTSKAFMMDDATFAQAGSVEDTDSDGIPDDWELSRFGDLITSGVGSNSDGDVWLDIEEYWADTDPLDDLSFFQNVITQQVGYGVMVLQAGPPTTNSRQYDVWWKTNLVTPEPWVPFNFNVYGRVDGLPVDMTVTNDGVYRFYQTGVKVP
ncbi:MAG: hypothetical protein JXB04_11505 [Kiritimatiellae bacterium]|nr:hypothetical protein [Kiritimatiellia bacterium]